MIIPNKEPKFHQYLIPIGVIKYITKSDILLNIGILDHTIIKSIKMLINKQLQKETTKPHQRNVNTKPSIQS